MNDVKKHHLRMTADLMSKELYSKKCAKKACDTCPARVQTRFGRMIFDGNWYRVQPEYMCLRSLLKQFQNNLKYA